MDKLGIDERLKIASKQFKDGLKPKSNIYDCLKALGELLPIYKEYMDKQIRKIEKKEKGVAKDLKSLAKADKKRDKICAMGEKAMKSKKGK